MKKKEEKERNENVWPPQKHLEEKEKKKLSLEQKKRYKKKKIRKLKMRPRCVRIKQRKGGKPFQIKGNLVFAGRGRHS